MQNAPNNVADYRQAKQDDHGDEQKVEQIAIGYVKFAQIFFKAVFGQHRQAAYQYEKNKEPSLGFKGKRHKGTISQK